MLNASSGSGSFTQACSATQAGFKSEFFHVYVPESTSDNAIGQKAAATTGTYFCAEISTHEEFCRSIDFSRYQNEMGANLNFLRRYCEEQGMPDANKIGARLRLFYQRRFTLAYFNRYEHLIDGQGKQALDHICAMIRDARIPDEKKMAVIRNLSVGVCVCASGVVSNLIAAEGELAMSSEGIRAALWKVKQDVVWAVIQEAVREAFCAESDHKSNEIHYSHAVWNYIADTIGLSPAYDPQAKHLEPDFLNDCQDKVRRAMTPDRLAGVLADECLALFRSQFIERGHALSGDWTVRIGEDLGATLQDIQQRYRLAPADLELSAFVRLDGNGKRYNVRGESSLVALYILRIMHAECLLEGKPVSHGQWTGSDGMQHALLTFGSGLAWRADRVGAPSNASDWDLHSDAEQLTVHDLRLWWKACGSARKAFPAAALRQAVDGADTVDIDDLPQSWFTDIGNLFIVLPRMTDDAAQRCLSANLAYFKEHLSSKACDDLIDRAMDRGIPILMLAQDWYRNPWDVLREPRDARGRSRLHYWATTGNAAAIDALRLKVNGRCYLDTGISAHAKVVFEALRGQASLPLLNAVMVSGSYAGAAAWGRLVVHPWVADRLGKRLPDLLEARAADGTTALTRAMYHGHAKSVRVLHDLFVHPAIAPHVRGALFRLLQCRSDTDAPGLLFAMEIGHAHIVKEYHAMLVADAIFPHIKPHLFALVRARAGSGTAGLVQAMLWGRAPAIRQFHAMLVDDRILPHIARKLPRLLTDKKDGSGCLAAALEKGNDAAIQAFQDMVADMMVNPLAKPYIEGILPKVVRAQTDQGRTGLGLALERGHAEAIKALHALLAHPDIRPVIARIVSKLLMARQRHGALGLSLAVCANHGAAIKAFGDMLTDDALLPLIRHIVGPLIRGVVTDLAAFRDASGMSALLPAMRENQSAGLTAFRRMIERPKIAELLDDKTRTRLRVLETDETAADTMPAATHTAAERGAGGAAPADTSAWTRVRGVVGRFARYL